MEFESSKQVYEQMTEVEPSVQVLSIMDDILSEVEKCDYFANSKDFNLLSVPTADILQGAILPRLSLKTLFTLRCTCIQLRNIIDNYFTVCVQLDFSQIKNVSPALFTLVCPGNRRLKNLNIKDCKLLGNKQLVPVFVSARNRLTCLDMTGCTGINNAVLHKAAISCKSLETLILRDCHWVSVDCIYVITLNLHDLRRLDLSACWEINDKAVMGLVRYCTKLEYLALARLYSLTDNSIRAISDYSKQLKHLDIVGCWRVTDPAIRLLGEFCKTLEQLEVKDCRSVTDASLARIRQRGVKVDVQQHPWQMEPSTLQYIQQVQRLNANPQI